MCDKRILVGYQVCLFNFEAREQRACKITYEQREKIKLAGKLWSVAKLYANLALCRQNDDTLHKDAHDDANAIIN